MAKRVDGGLMSHDWQLVMENFDEVCNGLDALLTLAGAPPGSGHCPDSKND